MSKTREIIVDDNEVDNKLATRNVKKIIEATYCFQFLVFTYSCVFIKNLLKCPKKQNRVLIGKVGDCANLIFVNNKVIITKYTPTGSIETNETYVRNIKDVLDYFDLNSLSVRVMFITHKGSTFKGNENLLCLRLGIKQNERKPFYLCFKEGLLLRYNNGEFFPMAIKPRLQMVFVQWQDSKFKPFYMQWQPMSSSLITHLNVMRQNLGQLTYDVYYTFLVLLNELSYKLGPALQRYCEIVRKLSEKRLLPESFSFPFKFEYHPQQPMLPQQVNEWLSFTQSFALELNCLFDLLKQYSCSLKKQCRQKFQAQVIQFEPWMAQPRDLMPFLTMFKRTLLQKLQDQQAPRLQKPKDNFYGGVAGLQD